jgi:hypothetical protein
MYESVYEALGFKPKQQKKRATKSPRKRPSMQLPAHGGGSQTSSSKPPARGVLNFALSTEMRVVGLDAGRRPPIDVQGLLQYSLLKMKAKRFKGEHADECFQCDEGGDLM